MFGQRYKIIRGHGSTQEVLEKDLIMEPYNRLEYNPPFLTGHIRLQAFLTEGNVSMELNELVIIGKPIKGK